MLIKELLLKRVLSELKIAEKNVSTFLIQWDYDNDTFSGTLYLNNTNKIYDFCFDFNPDTWYDLVWIKEKDYKVESKIVYSIDGVK